MLLRIHEIHGTAENIQHTPVDMLTTELAKFVIETLGIFPLERAGTVDADTPQILCDALPHPGNTLQISRY